MKAVIFGCAGQELTAAEAAFFADVDPWGFILFARNIDNPDQVKGLTQALRECVGREDVPILIDQEGGRVARLGPPHWRARPPMDRFGALYEQDPKAAKRAAYWGARLMAHELSALGINVNCVPVLDVPAADGHEIIGDRALARRADIIAELGQEVASGTFAGGVLPIIKHIPGHGRAKADSHLELPVVTASLEELRAVDFLPFKILNQAPMAMTAHVVYSAIDPDNVATLSEKIIHDIIRGYMGFDGLLMSDDLSMKALSGSFETRTEQAIAAGCDVILHCNGDGEEMEAIAGAAPTLRAEALRRVDAAWFQYGQALPADIEAEEQRFAQMMAPVFQANV